MLCFNDDKCVESRNVLIKRAHGKRREALITNGLTIGYLHAWSRDERSDGYDA